MTGENVFLSGLFAELRSNKILYAILRNYKTLPDSCGGSDIDLWVKKKDYRSFLKVLHESASRCGGVLASFLSDPICPRVIYQAPSWGVQFDIHIGVAVHRSVPYMANDMIENHIIEYKGIKVLAPEIDGLISFLKEILNNKTCKEDYCLQASDLICRLTEAEIDNYLCAFSKNARNKIVDVLRKRDYSKLTIKDLGTYCSNDLQTLRTRLRYKTIQAYKLLRVFKPLGYTIAVLGTDGSGKSFIIDNITPILKSGFHNGIFYNHMRPNYFPSLAVATGKKRASEEIHNVVTSPHSSEPSGFVGSIIRLSYYWLDYTWGYFRKVYLDKSLKTHIWLFDRYYYDYYLDQRRARINLPNWIVKFYGFFVPCPDLTICLGGDPRKIYARKPETSLEEVSRQIKKLKEFSDSHKKTVWVDTTVPPEESVNTVMVAIVEMMLKRYTR